MPFLWLLLKKKKIFFLYLIFHFPRHFPSVGFQFSSKKFSFFCCFSKYWREIIWENLWIFVWGGERRTAGWLAVLILFFNWSVTIVFKIYFRFYSSIIHVEEIFKIFHSFKCIQIKLMAVFNKKKKKKQKKKKKKKKKLLNDDFLIESKYFWMDPTKAKIFYFFFFFVCLDSLKKTLRKICCCPIILHYRVSFIALCIIRFPKIIGNYSLFVWIQHWDYVWLKQQFITCMCVP